MSVENQKSVDDTDLRILALLADDGRIALTELARRAGMSGPGVAERIRRLEQRGVIRAFTVDVDLAALGFSLHAIVRIKPRPGSLHLVERMILDEPRFIDCDKVTGDDCFVARLALRDIAELDRILDPFHDRAETSTAIVKSSPVRRRMPLQQ
ncbi:AsnC family transcriptional regulator [Hoeflea marina]|uniref:AsnC family transcriptional regulator n=1 Tax=Hoeflea marina TaxID=274592 RepID=A0A317PHT3_9HYPH|nr:Lrp/AsnC family transcriptional regulator [Hoeflea marina]PWV98950.1 AsnC family transcriptional regulator [Hoeflea marina]